MLLGFKKIFAPKVIAGLRGEPDGKRQTIRAKRKLGEGVVTAVEDISIIEDIWVNKVRLSQGLPFHGWLIKWTPKGEGQAVVVSNLPGL